MSGANAVIAILLAAYIGTALYQGNLAGLVQAGYADIVTAGFWKWLVALAILYSLASSDKTNRIFGPILMIALVGLLIYLAEKQPQGFQQLTASIKSLLTLPQTSSVSVGTPTPLQ